jgi:hypothetical protein
VKSILLAIIVALTNIASARELNDVKMEDQLQVNGKTLILNGMGLRKVSKFGIPIKVYVGGLYLEKKSSDSDLIIKSTENKRFIMEMLQNVDRDPMVEAFEKSYTENCVNTCEKKKELFGKFKAQIPSVRKRDRLVFTFSPDKVEFEVIGANAKKVVITGADQSQNILALFINKISPPTPELRSGLLGL